MCNMYDFPVVYSGDEAAENRNLWDSQETIEDKVILETEITLRAGPNITMKIHEESRPNSVISGTFESEEDSRKQGVIKVLNEDSESDFYEEFKKSPKTPRKVRFGGESFKLRTPESDSSHQTDNDDHDISTIKITVTDAISITTRKSLIPVRISSLPSTPKKSLPYQKSSRSQYKSAPNLTSSSSRIPLRKRAEQEIRDQMNSRRESVVTTFQNIRSGSSIPRPEPENQNAKENLEKELKQTNLKSLPVRHDRSKNVLSPVPVHNEIEVFHNLTRSPERISKNNSAVKRIDEDDRKGHMENENSLIRYETDYNKHSGALVKYSNDMKSSEKENHIPDDKAYNSFTIYPENDSNINNFPHESHKNSVIIEEIVEKDALTITNDKKPTLQQSLSSLTSEDEIWTKSEALESLVKMLKQAGTCEYLEAGPAALLFEALFACHHRDRLHTLADDALKTLIEGLRPEVLEQCLYRLALSLCKMGASSGVRLALVAMKKIPPKKLQMEVLGKGCGHRTREGALQIFMACARLYPRSDVEVDKIAEFASSALKDRRRRVRHAALETLAVVAQLTSAGEILDVVDRTTKHFPDSEEVVHVARTRLSRKQLPTVDLDGTIRYSSPTDQSETDWISGLVLKSNNVSSSPLSSASSSTPSINYWMHNSRHENNFNNGSTLVPRLPTPCEDDAFEDPAKIWVTDSALFSKHGKSSKGSRAGILRPVYILQPEVPSASTGRGHRKYDRGRSFSPPKQHRAQYKTDLVESIQSVINNSEARADQNSRLPYSDSGSFRSNGGFRKSFSSDQLYFSERLPAKHEAYSYSLSSRSSSTSTGSSTKSGFWHRELRSGIPIPVVDGKLKIRHSSSSSLVPSGPLIAKRSEYNSPQDTPASSRVSPRDRTTTQENDTISQLLLHLPTPRSSGSESSGYFTPSPPDAHPPPAFIKMDTEERLSSDVEELEPLDSPVDNKSRDVVDSHSLKSTSSGYIKTRDSEHRNASIRSTETNDGLGEIINDSFPSVESININNNETNAELRSSSNSIIIVPSRPSTVEAHRKSKSVVDLQSFLPEINPTRKSVNSAPPRNDETSLNNNNNRIVNDDELDEPKLSPPSILPPSMDYSVQHQDDDASIPNGLPKSKLERRFTRNQARKSVKPSPRVAVGSIISRPVSKPKETLHQVLAQMESPVWETIVQGLQGLTKLARQNPEVIENQMHQVCLSLAKQVKNLRSQVSRTACGAAGDLFLFCKRGVDMELEEIAIPLFQRTADTNRFLRADANAALDIMCEQMPANKVILVVTTRGCSHQNAVIRAAASRLLNDIVTKLGTDRVFQMPKELRDKILIAGANSLTDGNLDARSHGKQMYKQLMSHPSFQKYLFDAVPQNILRHISKVLASIKSEI